MKRERTKEQKLPDSVRNRIKEQFVATSEYYCMSEEYLYVLLCTCRV